MHKINRVQILNGIVVITFTGLVVVKYRYLWPVLLLMIMSGLSGKLGKK